MKRQRTRKTLLLISTLLFPLTMNYLSPYLIINGSFEGVLAGCALLFIGQFVTSLLFGRAFCGWVCPVGGLQEICAGVQPKPAKKKQNISPKKLLFSRRLRPVRMQLPCVSWFPTDVFLTAKRLEA